MTRREVAVGTWQRPEGIPIIVARDFRSLPKAPAGSWFQWLQWRLSSVVHRKGWFLGVTKYVLSIFIHQNSKFWICVKNLKIVKILKNIFKKIDFGLWIWILCITSSKKVYYLYPKNIDILLLSKFSRIQNFDFLGCKSTWHTLLTLIPAFFSMHNAQNRHCRRFHASNWPWPWKSFFDLWRSNGDLGQKVYWNTSS